MPSEKPAKSSSVVFPRHRCTGTVTTQSYAASSLIRLRVLQFLDTAPLTWLRPSSSPWYTKTFPRRHICSIAYQTNAPIVLDGHHPSDSRLAARRGLKTPRTASPHPLPHRASRLAPSVTALSTQFLHVPRNSKAVGRIQARSRRAVYSFMIGTGSAITNFRDSHDVAVAHQ